LGEKKKEKYVENEKLINQIKITVESITRRLDEAEERISQMEDKVKENTTLTQ
jgi:hypothetical protein